MAVGTVSGIEPDDNWQLISGVTASGTAVTFDSISGYKRLMVVWKAVTTAAIAWRLLKVNNNSTAGNYASTNSYTFADANYANDFLYISGQQMTNTSGSLIIENANKSVPHTISNFASVGANTGQQSILLSDPITRVDLFLSTSNFTGGTVQLWGVAG